MRVYPTVFSMVFRSGGQVVSVRNNRDGPWLPTPGGAMGTSMTWFVLVARGAGCEGPPPSPMMQERRCPTTP
jgi:hypothetical protein